MNGTNKLGSRTHDIKVIWPHSSFNRETVIHSRLESNQAQNYLFFAVRDSLATGPYTFPTA